MSRIIAISIVVLVILTGGWFFVSPLFIDRAVDEAPPVELSLPSRTEVARMEADEREALRERLMSSTAGNEVGVDESMDMATTPVQLAAGTFVDADRIHKGSGQAVIYQLADASYLVRLQDLRVTNGPALVVLLARHPDPRSAADVKQGYIRLGRLKGNIGNQNYPVPEQVDVTSFGSVVIWCELFDVLFSPAALQLY